ncbi:MAG: hypothetical protein QOD61_371 [Solirubrobacteraceae bacterium]|nr:hypothetical protein [Solirubrobacteraceae bacterium]
MSLETALHHWQNGDRSLREAPSERRATLERVCERIYQELRRRLGGSFSALELVAVYETGNDWYLQLAAGVAPDAPWAWDARVADAAFHRYLREAYDYAGGRLEL